MAKPAASTSPAPKAPSKPLSNGLCNLLAFSGLVSIAGAMLAAVATVAPLPVDTATRLAATVERQGLPLDSLTAQARPGAVAIMPAPPHNPRQAMQGIASASVDGAARSGPSTIALAWVDAAHGPATVDLGEAVHRAKNNGGLAWRDTSRPWSEVLVDSDSKGALGGLTAKIDPATGHVALHFEPKAGAEPAILWARAVDVQTGRALMQVGAVPAREFIANRDASRQNSKDLMLALLEGVSGSSLLLFGLSSRHPKDKLAARRASPGGAQPDSSTPAGPKA